MQLTPLKRLAIIAPFYLGAAIILFMPLGHNTASTFSPFDGYIHEALFGLLGLITFFTYSKYIQVTAWSLVVFAAYSEIIQSLVPTRTTDIRDLFNDCIGIAIALVIFSIVSQNKTAPIEISTPVKKKRTIKKKKLATIPS